ncbi:MAG TPA: alpha-2-macroglobulin family protein [Planctomycetota bacterium]|jgi:hypothetical protein
MSDNESKPEPEAPLPSEANTPEEVRREKMLAWHLGALDDDEMELIRGRLESDPDWQAASTAAQSMLKTLRTEAAPLASVPMDLGQRTLEMMKMGARKEENAPSPLTPLPRGGEGDRSAANPQSAQGPTKVLARENRHATRMDRGEVHVSPPKWFTPRVAAALFAACALPVLWMTIKYTWPGGAGESIYWRSESELAAGAPFAPFMAVRDAQTKAPLSGVKLAAYVSPASERGRRIPVGEGRTDSGGVLSGNWKVPDVPPGDYALVIEALSGLSVSDHVERSVKISRAARLVLSPDRMQARPSETIRVRTLLVASATEKPIADQSIAIDLLDPQGNRIGRAEKKSSAFGLAWAEFPLDSAAPEGDYKLKADGGGLHAEQTIAVKQYKLPPFRVTAKPEKTWFTFGERLKAKIEAQSFDGHGLSGAKAKAELLDVSARVLSKTDVELDAQGRGTLDLDGQSSASQQDVRALRVSVTVTDSADRIASGQAALFVASSPVIINAVPEAGELVLGVENRVYLVARAPDGSPVKARLKVTRDDGTMLQAPTTGTEAGATSVAQRELETDDHGVAVVTLSNPRGPAEIIHVRGSTSGSQLQQDLTLPVRAAEKGKLLLRTEKVVVRGGETLKVSALLGAPASGSADGNVMLALRQDGRTVAAGSLSVRNGAGQTTLTIPESVSGVLELVASAQLSNGEQWADSRTLVVSGSGGLTVTASADREKYKPGQHAKLSFDVKGLSGKGVPAAVSLVAVDDALVALAGEHPGLSQALQAAGINVLRQRSGAATNFDVASFGPEQGASPAAMVAVAPASVPAGNRFVISAGAEAGATLPGEQVIDTSSRRMAEALVEQREGRGWLVQCAWGLVVFGLTLLLVLDALSKNDSRARMLDAIAFTIPCSTVMLTVLSVIVLALCGVEQPVILITILAATLLGSHFLLLAHAKKLDGPGGSVSARLVTLIIDAVLIFIAYAGAHSGRDVTEWIVFGVVAALIGAAAQSHMQKETAPDAKPSVSPFAVMAGFGLVCFVLGALLVPALSARKSARWVTSVTKLSAPAETAMAASSKGFAEGDLAKIEKDFADHSSPPKSSHIFRGVINEELPWGALDFQIKNKMTLGYGMSATPGSYDAPSPPRLRWDFPETMIFAPQIVTDEQGKASYELDVADSLTRWRVLTDAIAAGGGTAWTETKLLVTQPFSADLTLPTDVTAGDVLQVPAVITNHGDSELTVELALGLSGAVPAPESPSPLAPLPPARRPAPPGEGDRSGTAGTEAGATKILRVPAKSVASVDFPVRFERVGQAMLTLNATSKSQEPRAKSATAGRGDGETGGRGETATADSDQIQRTLNVLPDGMPVPFAVSALIGGDGELLIDVPESALPGTINAMLKLHRGPLTQMLEGLESMLQEPHGCFEQTSSTTYPNVMVLRYLRANGVNKPELEDRARRFIAQGYQRLLGFEVGRNTGSFSLYGQAPASAWLTAYGLQEFTDMSQVYAVDPGLLERMRTYLRSQMNADGSFKIESYRVHESAPMGIAATAYVVAALGTGAPPQSIDFLRRNVGEIEKDGYLCALSSLALAQADRALAAQLAGRLRTLANLSPSPSPTRGGEKVAVLSGRQTLAWGYGDSATIEASALGVLALLENSQDLDLARLLLAGIQSRPAARGGWGSTHATVIALKALERASSASRGGGAARVIVHLNGEVLKAIDLPAEETAVPAALALKLPAGKSRVRIQAEGGPIVARVTGSASVAWSDPLIDRLRRTGALQASVAYDSTNVKPGQPVFGMLKVLASGRRAEVPMIEWGLAAGFQPDSEDLNALKAKGTLSRWEISGRKLRLYMPNLESGQESLLNVRFYPTTRGTLSAHAGRAYEYYRAEEAVALAPARFEIK